MKMKNVVTVIDVGSTKVCCCIAKVFGDGTYNIIGVGYCACVGMKNGTIVDMTSVEKSVAIAVESAEKMARMRVPSAYVSVGGKNVASRIINMSLKIGGRIITENDIVRLFAQVDENVVNEVVIHSVPVWYSLDSLNGVKDPIGMYANQLTVSMNVVTVPQVQLQNILLCLTRCHLQVDGVISSGYAAGIGIMSHDDMESNRLVIDFGGGSTTLSFFYNGIFCGSEVVSLGARHITNDIVYGLNISKANAERLKTLFGSAIPSISDDKEMLFAPGAEEDDLINLQQISKATLNQVIQARVEEILKNVKLKIDNSRFKNDFSKTILITGGGSLLTGIAEFSSVFLRCPVVLKKMKTVLPGTEIQINHDFSVALGMINLAQTVDQFDSDKDEEKKSKNFLKKTLDWIKNNL